MGELKITLECLEEELYDAESDVYGYFAYGRSVSSEEYLELIPLLEEVKRINLLIDHTKELIETIESNRK